jgi:hypothetical protein
MTQYIDLDRRFRPLEPDVENDPEITRAAAAFGLDRYLHFDDLLGKTRVVILAEPGTGKTEEFKAATARLRAGGKVAFFFRIELLQRLEVNQSIDIGTRSEFDAWLRGDEEGYFFLDSVDEALLSSHSAFEIALRRFADTLADSLNRARVFVSCRVSNWRATADLSMFQRYLPLAETATVNRENGVCEGESEPHTRKAARDDVSVEHKRTKDQIVFQLMPLSERQIRYFAASMGIANSNDFVDAIERADSMPFAERPQDLLELIDFWKSEGRLGRHAEMLEFNIKKKLEEHDPDRDKHRPLSAYDAHFGAHRIAAAASLQKKNAIILPDRPIDKDLRNASINPKEVLPDWSPDKIQILLDRAIFDEAVYGTIRFHHRSVREYLTAKWLKQLLEQGRSRRSIERLIFANKYDRDVVIPSMRPIAGWLALWDDRVRQRLLKIAPEVLIQNGDPSSLPVDFRKSLLIGFADSYAQHEHTGISFDMTMLRRLADPKLAPTVNDLLGKFSSHYGIRTLLLELIWQGPIADCTETALAYAADKNLDASTRAIAIRAVVAAGSAEQRRQLLEILLSEGSKFDPIIASELCEGSYPEVMSTEQFLGILEATEPPKKHSSSLLERTLEDIIRRPLQEELAEELLRGLHGLLNRPPFIAQGHYRISESYAWLLPTAIELANQFIQKKHPFSFDADILDIFLSFFAAGDYLYLTSKQERLVEYAKIWPEFRFSIFWHAVSAARASANGDANQVTAWVQVRWAIRSFWTPEIGDLERLFDSMSKPLLNDRFVALTAIFQIYLDEGRPRKLKERMKRVVAGNPELESRLQELLHPKLPDETKRWRRQERGYKRQQEAREKRQTEERQGWQRALREIPEEIKNVGDAQKGEIWQRTAYLYDCVRKRNDGKSDSRLGFSNWRALIDEFGYDLAKNFRDGCVTYWREYDPFTYHNRRTDHTIPWPRIIGLTGLAMEAADDLEWAKHISREEAEKAAHYAVCELNGFPTWFVQLVESFPDLIDQTIKDELQWELHWNPTNGHSGHILSAILYGDPLIRSRYKMTLLELLEEKEPANSMALDQSLSVVLEEELDLTLHERLTGLAQIRFKEASDVGRKNTWLIALLCLNDILGSDLLNEWISAIPSEEERRQIVVGLCAAFTDYGRERFGRSVHDYKKVKVLSELLPLIYRYVRVDEDRVGTGVYTPNNRDHAERTRSNLVGIVYNTPGRASYETLMKLSNSVDNAFSRDRMDHLAKERAALDAESEPWLEADVAEFAVWGERQPRNEAELYELALARFDDIKIDIEEGDESEAALLQKLTEETEVRTVFANRLKKSSRSRYTIGSEEEFADAKKSDIRFNATQVAAPVPVELKIADKWTLSKLFERFENQLIRQYMRVSRYGIYLLVHNGKNACWTHPVSKQRYTFAGLVEAMKQYSFHLTEKYPHVSALEVIGIDFTARGVRD